MYKLTIGWNMKKLLATIALIGCTTTAYAEAYATVTQVKPNYENVRVNVPRTTCRDIEVPIYGMVQRNGASSGDVLTGMLFGGLLGKGITGKDNGAAAGAVFGGMIAAVFAGLILSVALWIIVLLTSITVHTDKVIRIINIV